MTADYSQKVTVYLKAAINSNEVRIYIHDARISILARYQFKAEAARDRPNRHRDPHDEY